MKFHTNARTLFFLAFFCVATVSGSDIESLTAICVDCHGPDGISTHPDVPIIGGLSVFMIEENLFAFRDRARTCRTTGYRRGDTGRPPTSMCEIADNLSDEEITQIAEYFAEKPFVPAIQQLDPAKIARGRRIHEQECNRCHTESGSDPVDHASILAGQWAAYLRIAFAELRSGERYMPRNMRAKLSKLSDEDIEALVHFYASSGDVLRQEN